MKLLWRRISTEWGRARTNLSGAALYPEGQSLAFREHDGGRKGFEGDGNAGDCV